MSDEKSIVNFGDLTKPATVLIEKVSNAVGVLYEPRRIIKRAEAEAKAEKIKAIAGIELNEIEQRGIERLIKQETRKQENIESITAQAVNALPPDAKTEELDEDWIAHFFDHCEKVSDKEMQSLWSKLLVGEASKPGTYSKRTVDFVASMDKKDAELFTRFCQFTWFLDDPLPMIFDHNDEKYIKGGIKFADLKHLDSIGLISYESMSGYTLTIEKKKILLFYFDTPTLIEFSTEKGNKLKVGNAIFTEIGRELVKICGAQRHQEYYEFAIEQLFKQKVILSSLLLNTNPADR